MASRDRWVLERFGALKYLQEVAAQWNPRRFSSTRVVCVLFCFA